MVYSQIGQPQKALEYFHQALPLMRAAGDRGGEAATISYIGVVHQQLGQPQKALEYYNQALLLIRATGEKADEGATISAIGGIYSDLGQHEKALELYNQALPLVQAARDRGGEATTLVSIGVVYNQTGQPQQALSFFNRALPLERAVGDRAGEAATLDNIGQVYQQLGQRQKALEFYNQVLLLRRAIGDKRGEATTLSNIGTVYDQIGQPQQALMYYRQALPLRRAAGDRAGEAVTLSNIGTLYIDSRPREALAYLNQALPLRRAVGDREGEAVTLANLAVVEEALGQPEPAARHLRGALAIRESMRAGLGGLTEAKVSFLASNLHAYHAYIDLLLQQRNTAAAFAWAEKSKARVLLDLLAAGSVDLNKGITPEEQQRVQQLRRQENQVNQQLVAEKIKPAPDKSRVAALQQQLKQAGSELQEVTDRLYASYPDLARRRLAKTVTLADLAHFLPADTALLDYAGLRFTTLDPRSRTRAHVDKTLLFCVTVENGQPAARAYSISRSRAELGEKVNDFRQACGDPGREYRFKGQELYQLLVAPAAQQLAGKKRLLICPDGPLWGLPFQALVPSKAADARTFLAQRYEIDYSYSATAAQAALRARHDPRRLQPTGTLLAFANPDFGAPPAPDSTPGGQLLASARPIIADARPIIADARGLFVRGDGRINPLPGTEQEAAALKQTFPDAVIYTGPQAQKATALREAGKYRYLHFATHGLLNDAAPWMSAVVLAQPPPGVTEDQFLTARDFFDLKLSAELVVLSACDTARGEKQAGEGVVGLTWALFVAGAPSQVVSQWSVNDTATAALMGQFYAGLKAGKEKGAALRAAELRLLQDGQHGHPYYWAPFVLLGDWR